MSASNEITATIKVPVPVAEEHRPAFENAAVSFLLGHDRIRPELTDLLAKEGVDVRRLAQLSAPQAVGVCPTPGAREFLPDDDLALLCRERGVSLVDGGRVRFAFHYAPDARAPANELQLELTLPEGLGKVTPEQYGSVVRALFGDCALARPAQDYLRAFGVDVVRFAEANKGVLGVGRPMTSRASPEVESLLQKFGLETDRFGKLKVVAPGVLTLPSERDEVHVQWSKTTCC